MSIRDHACQMRRSDQSGAVCSRVAVSYTHLCHILEHEDNGMMAKIQVVPD